MIENKRHVQEVTVFFNKRNDSVIEGIQDACWQYGYDLNIIDASRYEQQVLAKKIEREFAYGVTKVILIDLEYANDANLAVAIINQTDREYQKDKLNQFFRENMPDLKADLYLSDTSCSNGDVGLVQEILDKFQLTVGPAEKAPITRKKEAAIFFDWPSVEANIEAIGEYRKVYLFATSPVKTAVNANITVIYKNEYLLGYLAAIGENRQFFNEKLFFLIDDQNINDQKIESLLY